MENLLLINFNGARYGLWEHALSAARGGLPLYRLPLSPPAIAGIAVLDDRSAVIADLAACLGSPSMKDAQKGTLLIVDPAEKIAGFGVDGAVVRVEHPADQVLAVPEAVRSPVIDTCVLVNGSVVPIINIRALHERLKQGCLDLPQADGVIAVSPSVDPASSFPVRAFTIGGERFCVSAAGSAFETITPERIAGLPSKYRWLAGIAVHDRTVLPLVCLDELLGIEAAACRSGVLLAGSDKGRHGLLVDEDLGIIDQQELRICGLPPLARRTWMHAAAVCGGTVYPLIEAGRIISDRAGEEVREGTEQYSPASVFPHRFQKGDVEIVEFSLLGTNHGVPKEEVKDIHPLLPISRIPHSPEIVMGVADLNGELLPVLDLAAIFGRRSAVNGNWEMMRIVNGDFQALVVTEKVRGDRTLSFENQKKLPIALPHQVLYGCYLDEGMVKLIMNVQSLAVHFEKTAVRELVTSLSSKFAAPTGANIHAAPKPEAASLPDAALQARDDVPVSGPVIVETVPVVQEPIVLTKRPILESRSGGERSRSEEEEERRYEAAAKASEEVRQTEAIERSRMEDDARVQAEEQARLRVEEIAKQQAIEDQRMLEESMRKQAEEDARIHTEEQVAEQERDTERRMAADEVQKHTVTEAERITVEQPPISAAPVPDEGTVQDQVQVETKKGTYKVVAAVLAAALVLIIIFIIVAPERQSGLPVLAPQVAPISVPKKIPLPEMAPLYLTVPPERVVPEQSIYTVVNGDTLWSIAKRFTGNPLNYPRVAQDNSIATPDLIFPGQRIKLVQEKR